MTLRSPTAVNVLNHTSTLLFTVGCEKALNQDDGQFWKKGYEFAFIDAELCADSRNYFALFQGFSRRLHRAQFSTPIVFEWELEGAHFVDATVGGCRVDRNDPGADCAGGRATVRQRTGSADRSTQG